MDIELVAILDAPKPSGMGMHGLILRDPSGFLTAGLHVNRRVNQREFDDLVAGGHVLLVSGEIPERLLGGLVGDAGALWVGDEFTNRVGGRDFQIPEQPRKGAMRSAAGMFWLDFPSAIFSTTQYWLKNALRRVVRSDDFELAKLMLNVDITSDYTRAALVSTSDDPARDLEWFLRLDSDSGLQIAVDDLETRLRDLTQTAHSPDGLVIALVAPARAGSHREGIDIAQANHVRFEAFRHYFEDEARRLFERHDREAMIGAGEIVTAFRSPEAILEGAVLERVRPSAGGVPSLVLDGLRHRHILEALRNVPSVKVELASITTIDASLPTGIEESMSEEAIERSPTEQEVGELLKEADFRLPEDRVLVDRALSAA
jgi:hypothetical protein